jgi:quinoprotein glucose dehydrogenase
MQGLPEDQLIDYTPELKQAALEALEPFQWGPFFQPPLHRDNDLGKQAALWCPGDVGGTNIDGTPAFDPETGILYVTSQKGCTSRVMVPGAEADDPADLPTGTTISAYAVGRGGRGPSLRGLPVYKPPYSKITAIDMNTGEHLWWVPVGETPQRYLENEMLQGVELPESTGSGRQAAQIVTANLLIHTGDASDGTTLLYARDKATGEELGRIELPVRVRYGIITYMHGGQQHIVVQADNNLTALKLAR